MKIEATNIIPSGLEAEIARLRTQANAWEQVWAALVDNAPDGWQDFSTVGSECAVNAIRCMGKPDQSKVGAYCDEGSVRAEFEAWAFPGCYDLSRSHGGGYVNQLTHYAWRGWQECDAAYRSSSPMRGFEEAFYELAHMLGMTAQPRSAKEVWDTQMRPLVIELMRLVEACEWRAVDEDGYEPAVAVSKALAGVKAARGI